MSVSSFLILYYINLGICLKTAVFWLGLFLIFSQILTAVGGGVAIEMSWFAFSAKIWLQGNAYSRPESSFGLAPNYCPSPIVG